MQLGSSSVQSASGGADITWARYVLSMYADTGGV